MRAIGYPGGKQIETQNTFVNFAMDTPKPAGYDLLISVKAVSVNPVDTKIRQSTTEEQNPPRVLGWDAAGIVEAVGDKVSLFKPGDAVFYAGDITRPGCNASHHLVDERITGRQPESLNHAEAAALPLTAITAWEALFDRLNIDPRKDAGKSILIIGGAGGVGSIAIQLAKQVANLHVIATASRDESRQWCLSLGADAVVNHHENMISAFSDPRLTAPDYILCLNDTDMHFKTMVELIAPQGMICAVVDARKKHKMSLLKTKSAGFVWEFMFTRSMFKTKDMMQQHELLNEIANQIDQGKIRTTLNSEPAVMNPENIRLAHQQLETGSTIGKIVLTVD